MKDAELFSAVASLDLSLTQFKALARLGGDDGATIKDLAAQMGLSLPAASRAIDGLHQRGYVERREDEHDRRVRRVRLTAAGAEIVSTLNEQRVAAATRVVETLTASERRDLVAALEPLVRQAEIASCRPGGPRT